MIFLGKHNKIKIRWHGLTFERFTCIIKSFILEFNVKIIMKCHDFEWMTLALNRKLSAWILLNVFYIVQEWNPLLSIHSFNYLQMYKKYKVHNYKISIKIHSTKYNLQILFFPELILPNNTSIIFQLQF